MPQKCKIEFLHLHADEENVKVLQTLLYGQK